MKGKIRENINKDKKLRKSDILNRNKLFKNNNKTNINYKRKKIENKDSNMNMNKKMKSSMEHNNFDSQIIDYTWIKGKGRVVFSFL